MLDNVVDVYLFPADEVERSNMQHRLIGLAFRMQLCNWMSRWIPKKQSKTQTVGKSLSLITRPADYRPIPTTSSGLSEEPFQVDIGV
jgi:hypothetical protein